jgi:2-haloacid dehalogenase
MQYTWLLFDADNTLFDYDVAEGNALRTTLDSYGIASGPEHLETYRQINARLWRVFEKGSISAPEIRIQRMQELFSFYKLDLDPGEFSQAYLAGLSAGSDLIEGAEVVVKALGEHYRLAIITNGFAAVQRPRLSGSPIHDCFEVVNISEEIGIAKPHVGFFEAAFESLGNPPREEALIIGDSLTSDMQGGMNYGVDTCWFNPTGASRDNKYRLTYEIKRLQELLSLLLPR